MALPPNTFTFAKPIDPSDVDFFQANLSQGGELGLLQAGESVVSFSLTLTAEAVAAGLQIRSTGGYAPTLIDNVLNFWPSVDPAYSASSVFDGEGAKLGAELTIVTNGAPARTKQKTLGFTVANQ